LVTFFQKPAIEATTKSVNEVQNLGVSPHQRAELVMHEPDVCIVADFLLSMRSADDFDGRELHAQL